ncbi:MAG: helix-turn-helix domain-containing protein [Lachnotalea sp.]
MIVYYKLFDLVKRQGLKKTYLVSVISGSTLAKLGNNHSVSIDVINRLCLFLDCQPGDITEYIPGE